MYDLIALDCPDEQTVVFNNPNDEKHSSSFTFDKVFSLTCVTSRIYEGGAKDVALSALTGVNATIFAYGQTSSGKTFTMRGITEYAIEDIYQYMQNWSVAAVRTTSSCRCKLMNALKEARQMKF